MKKYLSALLAVGMALSLYAGQMFVKNWEVTVHGTNSVAITNYGKPLRIDRITYGHDGSAGATNISLYLVRILPGHPSAPDVVVNASGAVSATGGVAGVTKLDGAAARMFTSGTVFRVDASSSGCTGDWWVILRCWWDVP